MPLPRILYNKKGRPSIWRVPNLLLEPRGSYFGEADESIAFVNKARSWIGVAILVGLIVYYNGLSHLAVITKDKDGGKVVNITNDTTGSNVVLNWFITITFAMLLVPLISMILVVSARSGARLATLKQLRWPFLTFGLLVGFMSALGAIPGGFGLLAQYSAKHHELVLQIASAILAAAFGIVAIAWLVKCIYLAANGLFRADDGHPLLAPIITTVAAWFSVLFAETTDEGTAGLTGVPDVVEKVTGYGGAIVLTAISVWSVARIGRRYKGLHPFRGGPLHSRPGASVGAAPLLTDAA